MPPFRVLPLLLVGLTRITAFVDACAPFALSLWGSWSDIFVKLLRILYCDLFLEGKMTLLTFLEARFISCRAPQLFRSGQVVDVDVDVTLKHVHDPFRKFITSGFSFFWVREMHVDRPMNRMN
jgi:hypothetical protein